MMAAFIIFRARMMTRFSASLLTRNDRSSMVLWFFYSLAGYTEDCACRSPCDTHVVRKEEVIVEHQSLCTPQSRGERHYWKCGSAGIMESQRRCKLEPAVHTGLR